MSVPTSSAPLSTATTAASGQSLTVATLQQCLADIQAFQKCWSDEIAQQTANAAAQQAYNNAFASWSAAKTTQDAALLAGHWAPMGSVWKGNQLISCNSLPVLSTGPFNLCGYYPPEYRACQACLNAYPGIGSNAWRQELTSSGPISYTPPAWMTGGVQGKPVIVYNKTYSDNPCNCGAAEPCHMDCSSGNTATNIRYNAAASSYQATYDAWIAANPQPVPPAPIEPVPISFTINCNVCTQNLQQGQINASSVTQGQINQTMDCFNQQISAAQAAADAAAAAAKTQQQTDAAAAQQSALASIASQASGTDYTMYIVIFVIFIAIIVIAAVIYSNMGVSQSPPYKQ